ncbi:MAG: SsrA-binding protein SmpB [Thiotrichaceae bacterium]|nr:SsrA-binding protein SmpB [Thiotrichaceae bacterium]
MAKKNKKKKGHGGLTIARNKVARHDYFIEDTFEAGLVLEGWEVKSLRDGRAQLKEAYVFVKNGEVWISGAQITPLLSASTHVNPIATRIRKLLLHDYEIVKLRAAVERKGYTIMPLALYWKGNKVKLEIGVGKGKQAHDKRASSKEKDWNRDKQRILKGR